MIDIYKLFKKEVRHKKIELELTNADLAKMAGVSKSAIERFMCEDTTRDDSDNVAKKLAAALRIEL